MMMVRRKARFSSGRSNPVATRILHRLRWIVLRRLRWRRNSLLLLLLPVSAAAAGLSLDKQENDGDLGSHMEVAAAAAGLSLDKQERVIDSGSHPPMPERYWKEYLRQGFDVGYFPGRPEDNLLGSIGSPYNDDLSIEIAQHAIDRHNKKNKDGQLKLERVVKIITQLSGWHRLYVTLEAFDAADQQVKTYQALLETIPELGGRVLKMFRLKPSSSETQQDKKHPLGIVKHALEY